MNIPADVAAATATRGSIAAGFGTTRATKAR